MKSVFFLGLALAGFLAVVLAAGDSGQKAHQITTISPRKMADSLHAVIAADREVYARVIVERLAVGKARLKASADWRQEDCLPVHAQMLRMAGANIQKRGAEFSYTLRSLWPINDNHGPQTAVEKAGMEYVAQHPGTNYYTEETLGGRSYFTAVYPDIATLPSCVECHNQHPASLRREFRLNDVMGAIIVRVPLEF